MFTINSTLVILNIDRLINLLLKMEPVIGEEDISIFSQVQLNELILDKIFSNLTLTELLPLRYLCRIWNTSIIRQIPEELFVNFSLYKPNYLQDIEYIKQLKVTKLNLARISSGFYRRDDEEISRNFNEFRKFGSQIRHLEAFTERALPATSKYEIGLLKTLLSCFPNLETFKVSLYIDVPLFIEEFNNFVYPSLKILNFPFSIDLRKDSRIDFVRQLVEVFPNLNTNFNYAEELDLALLTLVKEEKIHQTKVRKFKEFLSINVSMELTKIPAASLPLTNLELSFDRCHDPNVSTRILKNFANTLTVVKLESYEREFWERETEMIVPPLPKARKILLTMPLLKISKGDNAFYWNLGKSIAKDFPCLEYLVLNFVCFVNPWDRDEYYFTFGEDLCKIWDCFVPLSEEVDLSPLKYLKFVDLSIPNDWIGLEETRDWCSRFLKIYLKLYGNAGRVGTIADMIDWLE